MKSPSTIPRELLEILPKGIQLFYLTVDKIYAVAYTGISDKVSLSPDDISEIERKCQQKGLATERTGSVDLRLQLIIRLGETAWRLVSQSACESLDENSNPRMYGYLKEV